MANITGVSVRHDGPLRLTDIQETMRNARDDQHVRFSEAKGLHTHSRFGPSMVDFLAKFRNPEALRQRADMREQGALQVKKAIDNEYGAGMGNRVFARMGKDARDGVTHVETYEMGRIASELLAEDLKGVSTAIGAESFHTFFNEAHEQLGIMLQATPDWIIDRDELCGRIAATVLPLAPFDLSPDVCRRAALGEIVKFDVQQQMKEAHVELGPGDRLRLDQIIDACFMPERHLTGVDASAIHALLGACCKAGTIPTVERFEARIRGEA